MRALSVILLGACGSSTPVTIDAGRDGAVELDAATDAAADAAPLGPRCMANGIPGTCMDVADCYGSRTPIAGLCSGSSSIQCCTPRFADGNTCDPNASPQPNAALVEEPGSVGCPAGMAQVAGVCVDRFEAALVQLDGSPWSPFQNPTGISVRAVSLRGAVPQGNVSQVDAAAACSAAGKRLCTDTEWQRACSGPTSTVYPYGNTREPGRCNDARAVHPAVELYGTSASWIFSHLDSPCLGQLPDGLDPTGANVGCVSSDGIFDMMGNLHEWTANPAGTFRGGFYVDTSLNGPGCQYATTAHDVTYADYSVGFRCCAALSPWM